MLGLFLIVRFQRKQRTNLVVTEQSSWTFQYIIQGDLQKSFLNKRVIEVN